MTHGNQAGEGKGTWSITMAGMVVGEKKGGGGGRSNDIYLFHFYNGTDEAIFAYVKCLEGDEGWNGSSIDLYIPSLSGRSDTLQIDGSLQYC